MDCSQACITSQNDNGILTTCVAGTGTHVYNRWAGVRPWSEQQHMHTHAKSQHNLCRRSDGTDDFGDGEYSLEYADKSARVVIVSSEPITGATADWVMLPKNHALIVTRDTNGWMNVLHSPVYSRAPGPRLELVLNCQTSIPLGITRESVVPASAACLSS